MPPTSRATPTPATATTRNQFGGGGGKLGRDGHAPDLQPQPKEKGGHGPQAPENHEADSCQPLLQPAHAPETIGASHDSVLGDVEFFSG